MYSSEEVNLANQSVLYSFCRMNLTMSDTWGFPVNETNNYTGIVGLMQRGEVEIGAAGLLIKETRMDMVDYAGEIVTFR
jgi:hypothetical protein